MPKREGESEEGSESVEGAGVTVASASPSLPAPFPAAAVTSQPDKAALAREASRIRVTRHRAKLKAAAEEGEAGELAPVEGAADAAPAPSVSVELDGRSDDEIKRDVSRSLRGLWLILRGIAWVTRGLIGGTLEMLTVAEADEGADHFIPIARRYPRAFTFTRWISAPLWLTETIAAKFRPKLLQQSVASQAASGVEPTRPAPPPPAPLSAAALASRNGAH